MNRSFSKLRHIQEANRKLEQRVIAEQGGFFDIFQKYFGDIDPKAMLEKLKNTISESDVNKAVQCIRKGNYPMLLSLLNASGNFMSVVILFEALSLLTIETGGIALEIVGYILAFILSYFPIEKGLNRVFDMDINKLTEESQGVMKCMGKLGISLKDLTV